jgi:DNA-directed RNA polymerase specialized sigma24 family protein
VLSAVSHLRATPDPLDHAALAVANRPPTGDAWDVTIRRTADPLYRHLRRLLDTPEDAEDAVQEVFAAAMARGAPPDDDTVLFGLADTVARKRLAG